MYLYEKKDNRICFYDLVLNNEEIKKAKELEVYGKLDYKKVMVSSTNLPEEVLFIKNHPLIVNRSLNWSRNNSFHSFAEDYSVTEAQIYDYLNRVIERNDLPYIKVTDGLIPQYYCLANPSYQYSQDTPEDAYKEMRGIIPVSENLFMINRTINAINNKELLKINLKWLENYKKLFDVVSTAIPSIECINIETLYNYGAIPGNFNDFERQLKTSGMILERIKKD